MPPAIPAPLRLNFILNTFYSGPQAWFFVADDRGYFRDEGLDVRFTAGDTLANAVPRIAEAGFDAGYGDLNALVEYAAVHPETAPIAVFAMHNRSPYTLAVPAAGPVRAPRDLAGRRLAAHPNDAAWRMFPEFCRATGLDPSGIRIEFCDLPHKEMVPLMLAGRWDGLFGFVNTLDAQTLEAGLDPAALLRHLEWRVHVPALYGAAVMVSRALRATRPEAVGGLVRAINRGLADVVADIEAATDAVVRRDPAIDRAANRARLVGTLGLEMAHPEAATAGIGPVDPARLGAAIATIAGAKDLPRVPDIGDIFDPAFLPPPPLRVRTPVAAP
ncbi:ABC transporter substrate-binding protein [Aquabacter spiritensis]|uniref:NitT/TauT family transport system substrate-binding protein n=1 Tax=Aquabacter spiritensis TaxID=933073 RepID=A0A4R3M4N6_9HYPH|nr:ABC transporter substrate-binding protein [Aquabacter spiritensis]TCT06145.1 NitT/TauT family transport system substrate-binding protein [Aquabacter spiritensis]